MSDMRTIRYTATSHVGRVRKINEDSILTLPEHRIWLVSDGVGGHAAGDFASQTVVDSVAILPVDLPPADMMRALRGALLRAHDLIRHEAEVRQVDLIGATAVAIMLHNGHFVCFWVGDSRLYRFRDGEVELLTTDHSMVAELVLSGEMTWDEVDVLPQSNAITRAVGVGDALEIDKIRGDVLPGDRFLLCSDGLTKYARTDTLRRLAGRAPIETVADTLLQYALEQGGADNISIIVVDVV